MSEPAKTPPPAAADAGDGPEGDGECVWCGRIMTAGIAVLAAVTAVALANILTGGRTLAMLTGRQAETEDADDDAG
jgi:hypothetical protein